MWDSLKWLFKGHVLFLVVVIAITTSFGLVAYQQEQKSNERKAEKEKQEIILKGKANREDGLGFNANPYVDLDSRELWRQGWRSGHVVKE
jgi:predicted negative regulator of RcsB-dependent stress response